MAAVLPLIAPQNYELIRERIGLVITEELTQQGELETTNPFTVPTVYIERIWPFNSGEQLPAINVCLYKADYYPYGGIQQKGEYVFTIDVYTNSDSTSATDIAQRGDKLASVQMHRIIGKVRSILGSPTYSTLGFAKGDVSGNVGIEGKIELSGFVVADKSQMPDALNSTVGRMYLKVKVPEVSVYSGTVNLIEISNITSILVEGQYGYQFQFPQT